MSKSILTLSLFASLSFSLLCSAEPQVSVVGLFSGKAVVNIDGKRYILKQGKTGPKGIKLISANASEAVLEINGKARTFGLSRDYSRQYSAPKKVTVTLNRSSDGHYYAYGAINGVPTKFLVDTGATSVAMNSIVAKAAGVDYIASGTPINTATASDIVKTFKVNLQSVSIGGIKVNNVEAGVHEGRMPDITLLGMSFLRHVKMTEEGNVLTLEQKY
ncbi:retropepsin-like aspartic protease family protein [Spartinivicinus poritis]|uniref:TIGR02281 family clan AA aspartic protease n=1 Tax=Spartinivicinus poritis TaxID=2994640 RepID=A0ABT5U690_9GAMM|nr:TIGR02281 family clan AA aspartic protease [Spartinivicinus sp. A2-2]MDE1461822.1 TIGR02281 family clan AA aspartic protease [Spartinivicinus sp. A2-2]